MRLWWCREQDTDKVVCKCVARFQHLFPLRPCKSYWNLSRFSNIDLSVFIDHTQRHTHIHVTFTNTCILLSMHKKHSTPHDTIQLYYISIIMLTTTTWLQLHLNVCYTCAHPLNAEEALGISFVKPESSYETNNARQQTTQNKNVSVWSWQNTGVLNSACPLMTYSNIQV